MRVLVVGGTGFVSGAITRGLLARGHEVTVYHRGMSVAAPGARDIRSDDAAIPVMRYPTTLRADVVVHAVAVGARDVRVAMDHFRGVARRIVALSSGDVYRVYGQICGLEPLGTTQPALSEEAELRVREFPYGRGPIDSSWGRLRDYEKLHVERSVLGDPGLPGTILRLGKVFGPGDQALMPWLRALSQGAPIILGADVAGWRWTHVYVEDVAQAVALAVESEHPGGRIYNVGEGSTPTQRQRIELLASAAKVRAQVRTIPGGRVLPDLVLDSARIRRDLGWTETEPGAALANVVRVAKVIAGCY
jgi:nucleoside-diphosphate-sugar epimerase